MSIAWLATGILIGFLLSGIVYFNVTPHTYHNVTKHVHSRHAISIAQDKVIAKAGAGKRSPSPVAQYEFYNLLAPEEGDNANSKQENAAKVPDKFRLEVGPFSSYVEADHLKAQLLLIGIDTVTIAKSNVRHHPAYKVTVGPFNSQKQANKIQQQLKENAIVSTVVVG